MENRLSSLRLVARDAAHQAGLPRFWRWWRAELAALVPASARGAFRRRLTRPIIEFADAEAIFWRPEVVTGELRLVAVARVPLHGDAGELAAAGRAGVAALATDPAAAKTRVVVALPPRQVLRKEIALPAAVEENLAQALTYDLDRHTPFRPEQLYFDAVVTDRDPAARTIRVDWAAALKTAVDSVRRQAEEWGASVAAVIPGPASTAPAHLNLLPDEARSRPMLWRRWQLWAPAALIAVVALAALAVPLMQKREYAIALTLQTEAARQQAQAADALRAHLERLQGDYNYVLAKKYAYPGPVQILDEVTKLLPDDTWISALEVKATVRGKDVQREMLLRGESANAGKLISLLEDSKLVEQAALRSPTTKLQPGPGEVFDLGSQLRTLPIAPSPGAAPQDSSATSPAPMAPAALAPQPAPAPAAPTSGAAAAAPAPVPAPPMPAASAPSFAAPPPAQADRNASAPSLLSSPAPASPSSRPPPPGSRP